MAARWWYEVIIGIVFALSSGVLSQEPFVYFNKTIPIGDSGFVRWDADSFPGPVNLWLQQLAPNASAVQVPLDYVNTKGFFLWAAGPNLKPGQYFYQLQSVGTTDIIYKSNPLMLVCPDCAAESTSVGAASITGTGSDGRGSTESDSPELAPSSNGVHLSPGAAAGIGVGGTLLLVATAFGLIYFFVWRREQRQNQNVARPSITTSSHPSSFDAKYPPSHRWPSYDRSQPVENGFVSRPPMAIVPEHSSHRTPSHELDSAGTMGGPPSSGDQPRSNSMTPRRDFSRGSRNTVAPETRHSPPAPLPIDGFQYRHLSYGQALSPTYGPRSSGSNHDNNSDRSPSQRESPNLEPEGFQLPEGSQQSATRLDNYHHLIPRRMVGSPDLRSS